MDQKQNTARECMDLSGSWRVCADCGCDGAGEPNGNWRDVTIPCTFEHCLPELIGFRGTCWFEKRFTAPSSMQGVRMMLGFQAVNYHATVWVNGKYAGSNDEGFLPFDIPVSGLLRCGAENCILVRANNETAAGELPPVHFWRSQGGIIRKVELVATGWVHIQNTRIHAYPQGSEGRFHAEVTVRNELGTAVQAQLLAEVTARGSQEAVLSFSRIVEMNANSALEIVLDGIVPDVTPWSPDAPCLYTTNVELLVDGKVADFRQSRFGFRSICVQDGKVLLNGKPVFFNGFNRHEDYPDTRLPIDSDIVRQDFEAIKRSGANFVRMCHYPHDSAELDVCDELGLLVMDEIPLCALLVNIPGIDLDEAMRARELTLDHAKAQLKRLVSRDFNHPCVIFWSVSNETNELEPGVTEINNALIQLAKALDPTRLTMHVSM